MLSETRNVIGWLKRVIYVWLWLIRASTRRPWWPHRIVTRQCVNEVILEARVSGQPLPLAACYQKIEAREWSDNKKSDFWICFRNGERPNYKKSDTGLPACSWRSSCQGAALCQISSWLASELCRWCSADPAALRRHARGEWAGRWAYKRTEHPCRDAERL